MPDLPDLGRLAQPQPGQPRRIDPNQEVPIAANLAAFPRHIGPDNLVGHYRPGSIPRSLFLDGEQFLAAIQGIVRHENRVSEGRRTGQPFDGAEYDYLTPCAVIGCSRPQDGVQALGLGDGVGAIGIQIPLCAEHGPLVAGIGETMIEIEERNAQQAPPAGGAQPLVLG